MSFPFLHYQRSYYRRRLLKDHAVDNEKENLKNFLGRGNTLLINLDIYRKLTKPKSPEELVETIILLIEEQDLWDQATIIEQLHDRYFTSPFGEGDLD